MAQSGLAAVGIWSADVYYRFYIHSEVTHAISPLADQGTAGAIMFGEGALVAICLIVWIHQRLSSREYVGPHGGEGIDVAANGAFAVDRSGIQRPSQPAR
jgi:hypothetical protein